MKSIKHSPVLSWFKRIGKPKFDPTRFDTLISRSMVITNAVIDYSRALRVEGTLVNCQLRERRDFRVLSMIYIRKGGMISLNDPLACDVLWIDGGELYCNRNAITVRQQLLVKNEGKLVGDVNYTEIKIEAGSTVSGTITRINDAAPDSGQWISVDM